jgi:predicted lysophospholipase L1 biosynthesis ABC-type transport system permease subunit
MIGRLVYASLRRRGRQLLLIATAVAVAAATVVTLTGFTGRSGERLGTDLAAFGPNLTVRPQLGTASSLPASMLARVRALPGVLSATGVVGPAAPAGAAGPFAAIAVRVAPSRLTAMAAKVEATIEGVEATPLLRVSVSESSLIHRVQRVLQAISVVSIALALLSVASATATLISERRNEVGLMMALGYPGIRIGGLFAAELVTAALLAAGLGVVAGDVAASTLATRLLGPDIAHGGWISARVFGQDLVAAAAVALGVVGGSLAITVRRFSHLEAARILRGDT